MSTNIDAGTPAFPVPDLGDHHHGLTARQYAAIKLRVPDSGTEWLDDMIRKSLRDDFAAKAMQGMFSNATWDAQTHAQQADDAYFMADCMLESRDEDSDA